MRKGRININPSTRQQLVMLTGIDRNLSIEIVMRRKRPKFMRIEDILKVEGALTESSTPG